LPKSFLVAIVAAVIALSGVNRASEPTVEVLRARTYVVRESGALAADVYMPHGIGPFPAILLVHGGAWTTGSRYQVAMLGWALAEHGYTAAAITYRLAPQHKFPAQIHDCQAAVRWMREHAGEFKIDRDRIGGLGYSAGGHLVALLGSLDDDDLHEEGIVANAPSARLQVVLAGGAVCDVRTLPANSRRLAYWLGDTRAAKPEVYRDASPANYITAEDPPMFFFHGSDDFVVPINGAIRMVRQLQMSGVTAEMYTIKNSGHIQTFFDPRAFEHALAFADRYLKPDSKIGGAEFTPAVGTAATATADGSNDETSHGN
jgi:acetyl esterase/lipase